MEIVVLLAGVYVVFCVHVSFEWPRGVVVDLKPAPDSTLITAEICDDGPPPPDIAL